MRTIQEWSKAIIVAGVTWRGSTYQEAYEDKGYRKSVGDNKRQVGDPCMRDLARFMDARDQERWKLGSSPAGKNYWNSPRRP